MSDIDRLLTTAAGMVGQNREMPSRLDPEMPERVACALKAVSGNARLLILRFLLAHPESTRPAIMEASGMSAAGTRTALLELEESGYISADVDGNKRNGRTVRYTANRALLTDDMLAFTAWLLR